MQINKINSINSFKGLWSMGQVKKLGYTRDEVPIFVEDNVYRPFKGESPKQIEKEIEKSKLDNIKTLYGDKRETHCKTTRYLIMTSTVGKELNVTEDEYREMQKMKKDPTTSLVWKSADNPPKEIARIANEL